MISHLLAYVTPTTRHLAPTMGPGAPSSRDLLWTGTLFLPSARSEPDTPDGACPGALHGVEAACVASYLANLLSEVHLSGEPAPGADAASSESCLIDLLGKIDIASESASDLESIGSTDPMLVDSDTASLDAFPTNVMVIDEPLPRADGDGSTITEVLVISHGAASGGNSHDALQTVLHNLSAPIPADADAKTLEARRLALIKNGKKIATMRCLTEAYQHEVDRAASGTPAAAGPSRLGTVKKHGAAIASMLGAERPVYAMPLENLHAAQAVADELEGLEGDELCCMMTRVQQLIDAAVVWQEADTHAENSPLAESMAQHLRRQLLVAPASGITRSRLLVAVGLASPSRATKMAAPEPWIGEATTYLLPRPAIGDILLRRLLGTQHSGTG